MPTRKRPSAAKPRRGSDPLDARAARAAALDALSRRDHASAELHNKLLRSGYDAAIVDELIGKLRAERLLDDNRYMENFLAYRAARGHGPNRVRADFLKMGLQTAQFEPGLKAYPEWMAQLERARQKKFGTSAPTNYADRERQARFLAYRGFTGAQIRAALGLDFDLDAETT